ncbi:MAG: DUF4937 domain-containing protein [Acidobacteriota bacterium]
MLAKLIRCGVDAAERERFARAQAAWSELTGHDGLLVQVGGWTDDGTEALVIALWRDVKSHERFLADEHDRIVAASGQDATYRSIDVQLVADVGIVLGEENDPVAAFAEAARFCVSTAPGALTRGDWRSPGMRMTLIGGSVDAPWIGSAWSAEPPDDVGTSVRPEPEWIVVGSGPPR